MRTIRTAILCFTVLVAANSLHAQTDSAANRKPAKKSWYLTLGIDQKMNSFYGTYKSVYEGEYNNRPPFSSGPPEWEWRKTTWEEKDMLEWSQFYSTKIDILLSRDQKFKAGLSYNFGPLLYEDTAYRYLNLSFVAITGLVEYNYYFHQEMKASPFAFGSLAAGFYRESPYNGGPGRELFTELRGGLGYRNNKDWIFRIWAAGNWLNYRESSISPVFKREQNRKIDMALAYWGLGVYRQFELVPE
jgi:hypothetical protein